MTHERLSILNYDPSANGTFSAWDQFAQITDQKWTNNGSTADRYQYAYDYDGNREYRQNSGPSATNLDEAYTYDTLDRVTDLQRGTLSGTTISGTPSREQVFTLDELGNSPGYLTKTSGTTDLTQTRTHSTTNEITAISGGSWIVPTYDTNGNMKDMPIPGNETVKQTAVYDAWNRMVEMEDHTGAAIAIYRYNGLNYRVQKLLGSNPSSPTSPSSSSPFCYYYYHDYHCYHYTAAPVVRFHDPDGTPQNSELSTQDSELQPLSPPFQSKIKTQKSKIDNPPPRYPPSFPFLPLLLFLSE